MFQESLSDENHILASAPYVELLEEAERLRTELERCQSLVEEAQVILLWEDLQNTPKVFFTSPNA